MMSTHVCCHVSVNCHIGGGDIFVPVLWSSRRRTITCGSAADSTSPVKCFMSDVSDTKIALSHCFTSFLF